MSLERIKRTIKEWWWPPLPAVVALFLSHAGTERVDISEWYQTTLTALPTQYEEYVRLQQIEPSEDGFRSFTEALGIPAPERFQALQDLIKSFEKPITVHQGFSLNARIKFWLTSSNVMAYYSSLSCFSNHHIHVPRQRLNGFFTNGVIEKIVAELAHAEQCEETSPLGHMSWNLSSGGNDEYYTPGSLEYDAHQIRQPRLEAELDRFTAIHQYNMRKSQFAELLACLEYPHTSDSFSWSDYERVLRRFPTLDLTNEVVMLHSMLYYTPGVKTERNNFGMMFIPSEEHYQNFLAILEEFPISGTSGSPS